MAGQLGHPAIPAARPSPAREDDYTAERAALGDAPLPETVDLRRDWQAIGDQGRTASCVGWAVTDVLRWQLVQAGELETDRPLSPRHVWTAAKEMFQREAYPSTFLGEDGTSLKAGIEVVRKFGAVLESELPWATGLAAGPPEEFNASARSRRIMAYFNLGTGEGHFDEWRRWLHESGPVLVLINKEGHVDTTTGELDAYDPATVNGCHAATLFGYGPGYFLLRSNWGTDWAEQGYARMSLAYAAQAVLESYGIVV